MATSIIIDTDEEDDDFKAMDSDSESKLEGSVLGVGNNEESVLENEEVLNIKPFLYSHY